MKRDVGLSAHRLIRNLFCRENCAFVHITNDIPLLRRSSIFVTKQGQLHVPAPGGAVLTGAVTNIQLKIRHTGRFKPTEVTRLQRVSARVIDGL
jgi:hypothetical protein